MNSFFAFHIFAILNAIIFVFIALGSPQMNISTHVKWSSLLKLFSFLFQFVFKDYLLQVHVS